MTDTVTATPGHWATFWQLPVAARAGVLGVATLVLAVVVVGLFPDYGTTVVAHVQRQPLSSLFIGTVVSVLLVACVVVLWVASARSETVAVVALPFLFVLVAIATVWTSIGLVGICQAVASGFGRDHLAWGVLGAVVLAAAAVVVPYVGLALAVLAAVFGIGAGIRTSPGARTPDERVVPPERKV